LFWLGALLLLAAACPALAGEPLSCGQSPIRVAYFRLGYRFYVEDGQDKGMNVDILQEIARRSGCQFSTQEMTFARIWADLESGDVDVSPSGIWSATRDRFLWCVPSIISKNSVVIGAAAGAKVHGAGEFLADDTLVFGVVRGYTHGKEPDAWLETLRAKGRVEESASVDVLFEKLKLGRIDALFAFPFVYRKFLAGQDAPAALVQDWFPQDKGILGCTMLAKRRFSEPEANQWRALIRQMQADGTLKRIFMRYVSEAEANQMLAF
jgi:polar amino acid transport system substrate-binding protein